MSTEIRRLLDRVQRFTDAVDAWQASDLDGYHALIALVCAAKEDFKALLAPPGVSPRPSTEEPCPHCHLPATMPDVCTPELNDVLNDKIKRDSALFEAGYALGLKCAAGGYQEALHRPDFALKPSKPWPRPDEPCPECDGEGTVLDAPADVLGGHPYQTECPECHGTGKKQP